MYVYIYIPINLVGGFNPSEKYIVSWDEYSQLNGNIKFMFQTQTINGLMSIPYHGYTIQLLTAPVIVVSSHLTWEA